jgi:hypothetical protein
MAKNGKAETERARFWRGHIEAWKVSGLSIAGYCRRQRLAESGFYSWKRKLSLVGLGSGLDGKTEGGVSRALGLFKEVRLPGNDAAACEGDARIELLLRGGRVLRVWPGFDAATLCRVLAVTEDGAC